MALPPICPSHYALSLSPAFVSLSSLSSSVAIRSFLDDAAAGEPLFMSRMQNPAKTGKQLKDVVGDELSTEAALNSSFLNGSPHGSSPLWNSIPSSWRATDKGLGTTAKGILARLAEQGQSPLPISRPSERVAEGAEVETTDGSIGEDGGWVVAWQTCLQGEVCSGKGQEPAGSALTRAELSLWSWGGLRAHEATCDVAQRAGRS